MVMMITSPFDHRLKRIVGALLRRCEMYPHQSLYVMKTTYPFVIEEFGQSSSLRAGSTL
jgi:hypothetical protein